MSILSGEDHCGLGVVGWALWVVRCALWVVRCALWVVGCALWVVGWLRVAQHISPSVILSAASPRGQSKDLVDGYQPSYHVRLSRRRFHPGVHIQKGTTVPVHEVLRLRSRTRSAQDDRKGNSARTCPQPTTHNPQPTTHNPQPTHNAQPHNPQRAAPQPTTRRRRSLLQKGIASSAPGRSAPRESSAVDNASERSGQQYTPTCAGSLT